MPSDFSHTQKLVRRCEGKRASRDGRGSRNALLALELYEIPCPKADGLAPWKSGADSVSVPRRASCRPHLSWSS